MLFDNLTRAILRIAELGFLGVITVTERHTPLFCGAPRRNILEREVNALWTVASARDLPLRFERERFRGLRTSWFRVGNLMALRIPMLVKRLCVYAFQVSLAIVQAIPRSLNDSSYNNPRQDSRRSFMNSESRCMNLSRSRASACYPYARSIIIVQRSMPTDSRCHHSHLASLRSCGIDRSTALRNDLFTLT